MSEHDNSRTAAQVVMDRIDEITRRWKKAHVGALKTLRLHYHCFFPLNARVFHPTGDWSFSNKCSATYTMWVLIEAALQEVETRQYLAATWQITPSIWRAMARAPYGMSDNLGNRLMSPAPRERQTARIHQVVLGLVKQREQAVGN